MKGLLAVFALLAVLHNGASLTESQLDYFQKMRNKIHDERVIDHLSSLCPEKRNQFEDALEQMKLCSEEIDEKSETICSVVKNHFIRCSRPLIKLVDSCLPSESKGVPEMLFQSIANTAQYLCKTDGEHIFELANTCFHKSTSRSGMCQRRAQAKLQQFQNELPSKQKICDLMQSMKGCFHNHVQSSCGNAITRESFMGLFNAAASVCSSVEPTSIEVDANEIDNNDLHNVELLSR